MSRPVPTSTNNYKPSNKYWLRILRILLSETNYIAARSARLRSWPEATTTYKGGGVLYNTVANPTHGMNRSSCGLAGRRMWYPGVHSVNDGNIHTWHNCNTGIPAESHEASNDALSQSKFAAASHISAILDSHNCKTGIQVNLQNNVHVIIIPHSEVGIIFLGFTLEGLLIMPNSSAWFAFFLPCYATYKALSSSPTSEPDLKRWSMYWVVMGVFVTFEYLAEWLISWWAGFNLQCNNQFMVNLNSCLQATFLLGDENHFSTVPIASSDSSQFNFLTKCL